MSTPDDFSKIAGPMLIGHLLQWGLFGALSVQVYLYYLAFPKDPLTTKILVYAVYAIELTQTILFSKMAFQELAAGFGRFEALNEAGNFWFSVPILSSTVGFIVQLFYAYKIKLLAHSNFIALVVVLFALVQLGGGIAQGAIGHQLPLFSEFLNKRTSIANGIWNGGSAVCDIIIAAAMTYYLSKLKTTWKATQRIVQKLTTLFIETGTLTATIAIINFVLFVLPGHPIYFQTTSEVLGKMYSNTMMVVINSRIVFGTEDENVMVNDSLPFSAVSNPAAISQRSAFGSISMTHDDRTAPFGGFKVLGAQRLETSSDNVHVSSEM